MEYISILEAVPKPDLIPPQPANGCPSNTHRWGVSCCCGDKCCWDNCRLKNPPESCLNSLEGTKWMWDPNKERWVAQKSKIN